MSLIFSYGTLVLSKTGLMLSKDFLEWNNMDVAARVMYATMKLKETLGQPLISIWDEMKQKLKVRYCLQVTRILQLACHVVLRKYEGRVQVKVQPIIHAVQYRMRIARSPPNSRKGCAKKIEEI